MTPMEGCSREAGAPPRWRDAALAWLDLGVRRNPPTATTSAVTIQSMSASSAYRSASRDWDTVFALRMMSHSVRGGRRARRPPSRW